MITAGQAKRLLARYGATRVADETAVYHEVLSHAPSVRDPQGVYADARALAAWCAHNPTVDLTDVREDKTVVPWGYNPYANFSANPLTQA